MNNNHKCDSYFNELPIELNTIIISYTLPRDYDTFIKCNFDIKLHYHQLFRLQFTKYYTTRIINYNITELYSEFIKLLNNIFDDDNVKIYRCIVFWGDRPSHESIVKKFKREKYQLHISKDNKSTIGKYLYNEFGFKVYPIYI